MGRRRLLCQKIVVLLMKSLSFRQMNSPTGKIQRGGLSVARWPWLIGSLILLGLLSCNLEDDLKNKIPPDFRLTVFNTKSEWVGREISLADLKGKPAAIFFTASYCTTCEFMYNAFAPYWNRGMTVISVGVLDDETRFKQKVENLNVIIPVAYDTDSMSDKYSTQTLPMTVFITPSGRFYKKIHGTFGESRMEKIFTELQKTNESP